MIRIGILICFVVVRFLAWGQADTLPSDKDLARLYITQLKNAGAIVVRLKSHDKAIAAYRNSGNHKIADEMIERDRKLNLQIIDAFKTQFRFCPVYFMYARHSKAFVEGSKRNIFVNDGLREDSTIAFNHPFYLFVDYGTAMINQSANAYTATKQTQESSTPGTGMSYVVLDTNYRQIHPPFPYQALINNFEQNQHQKAVSRLNKKFFEFYIGDKEKQRKEAAQKHKKAKKNGRVAVKSQEGE